MTSLDQPTQIAIVRDPVDTVARQGPVAWAVERLREALAVRGEVVRLHERVEEAAEGAFHVLVAGGDSPAAAGALGRANARLPQAAEALALIPLDVEGRQGSVAVGRDALGLVYAVLELTDRVRYGEDVVAGLRLERPVVEQPANAIRSIMRLFSSDVEDMGWFHDRTFWRRYLDELATQRFNRFNLSLGLGYDFPRAVRDAYLYFSYPFLLSVPGYDVRVRGLAEGEQERNLQTLRFIARETVGRGLRFQLGLWTHAYETVDSPEVNYTIEGLTTETHAGYCRDALRGLLHAVPEIGGVTIRTHGESGIAEGSYEFWETVLQGAATCGRRVELDLHPKGLDWRLIEIALATGLPTIIAPKYWAEHQGLPYHQAGIRPTERVLEPGTWESTHMAFSAGSRRFTRYGYADFMREDRPFGVLHRVWPGTQRLLLWGDPLYAAAYSRAGGFAGSLGMEWFEPLSFKGRKGSGLAGDRGGYADESLATGGGGWEKYAYTYRLLGRLLYNPEAAPETWRRFLRHVLGAAAAAAEAALGAASRILPLVTTAHLPSAANYGFWAELPTNMPIVDAARKHPYGDTPAPKRFGTVSPLDPVLFSRVDDYADELASGEASGKYSPLEVAACLERFAREALEHLDSAEAQTPDRGVAGVRRLAVDVRIQAGVGQFYAEKLRAGVAWALYERTGDRSLLEHGLAAYRRARTRWAEAAAAAEGVYVDDLTFGPVPYLRGTWADRMPAIDADIADMQAALDRGGAEPSQGGAPEARGQVAARWQRALGDPGAQRRVASNVQHTVPQPYRAGEPVEIVITAAAGAGGHPAAVRLHYRHVNQAAGEQVVDMEAAGSGTYRATIPAQYTDSPYALLYFFELRDPQSGAWLYPGFTADFANEPYCVVRQR